MAKASKGKNSQNQNQPNKADLKKVETQLKEQNELLAAERLTRKQKLMELAEQEVVDLYFNTFGEEADQEKLTIEQMVDSIVSELLPAPALASEYKSVSDEEGSDEPVYGNKNKEIPVPKSITRQKDWENNVIAYIVPTRVVEGERVDLKKQSKVQVFVPKVWQRLVDQKHFAESKERVEILHQP